jgi:translocation and assembly module TamB
MLAPDADTIIESTGTLQMSAPVASLDQLDGTVRIDRLRLVNGPYTLATARAPQLTCRRGACRLEGLELSGPNTEVTVGGTFGGGAVRIAIDAKGDLRLLELAVETIESARGEFVMNAEVRRAGGAWSIDGELRLDKAALDLGGPVGITRTTARLVFSRTSVRISELSGRMGTGTFAVTGAVDLLSGPDLGWMLTDVGAVLIPSLEAEASGRGSLTGTWQGLRLAGDITVSRMLYDRDIELVDFLPSLNRALANAPRPPSGRQLELDLHVVAPGELYVENNVARIEARADLRLTGTAQRPVLAGRVEALDGDVIVRGRTFELTGATADFRPDLGLAAALNIGAESTIDTPDATYVVGVRVTGTTTDPRIALSSDDPALSQTDIGTLIAVGQTTSQMREGGGAGFSIYDALGMVPKQVTEPIQRGATKILPIDRISFESVYSRTSGTFQPQLKLGKDLTDELAVAIGQTFGVESRTIAEADYRLSPRVFIPLSWESQTENQEGAFGAGVKLRYEFWRVTPYTLLGVGALR